MLFASNNREENDDSSLGLLYLTTLLPLILVYISNQWSRSSLYYLVNFSENTSPFNAMNVDLNFSQSQYGLLASVAFTSLFAIASLFGGNLADKLNRKFLTISSCVAWSVATLSTAFASDYNGVLASRVLMGLACAFTTPAAYTLIRDLFPAEKRALASSLYGSGVYFGGGLASLSILLDETYGWRGALQVIGVYGVFACAVSALILPGDPNFTNVDEEDAATTTVVVQEEEKTASFSLVSDALSVLSTSPRVQLIFGASFFRFCAGLCIGVWSAPYFRLAFPNDAESYALINAFIVSVCGVTSGVLGGALADKLGSTADNSDSDNIIDVDMNGKRMLVPIVGSLLAIPAWYMVVHAATFQDAMIWLGIEYIVAECWFGPTVAVLQSSVGEEKGGTAQGMFTLTGALGNLAPAFLGVLYGQQQLLMEGNTAVGSEESVILSNLLGVGVCLGYLVSAVGFALSAQAGDGTDG